jgi:hypothetical protein
MQGGGGGLVAVAVVVVVTIATLRSRTRMHRSISTLRGALRGATAVFVCAP